MQNQLIIKIGIFAVVLSAAVWLLWPAEEANSDLPSEDSASAEQNLVSAIQPIKDADALPRSAKLPEVQTQVMRYTPDPDDLSDFEEATKAIQSGDYEKANQLLQQLIDRQPGLLEPYINLASSQAASGDLNQARETLMRGLAANKNYGALFNNLQKVHAALAADAYQLALADSGSQEAPSGSMKRLELPLVTVLNASVAENDEAALKQANAKIAQLENTLNVQQRTIQQRQNQLAAANTDLQSRQTALLNLQEQLKVAESSATLNSEASETANSKISALQARLSAAQQQITELQKSHEAEVAQWQQRVADSEKSRAEQQQQSEQQLLAAKEEQQRQAEQIAELSRAALTAVATVDTPTTEQPGPDQIAAPSSPTVPAPKPEPEPTPVDDKSEADQLAIARVKSWAQAWSQQDVSAYIDHYQDGYTPAGSSISNADWRAQRQVRLTNKQFIEVTLSGFATEPDGALLNVSFVQRYRSNTMDDTIRKELSLTAPDGDWSRAKIVSERVLR